MTNIKFRGRGDGAGERSDTGANETADRSPAPQMRGGERAVDHAMVLMQLNMPIICKTRMGWAMHNILPLLPLPAQWHYGLAAWAPSRYLDPVSVHTHEAG